MAFEIMKISQRGEFMSREKAWLRPYRDTHVTLAQLAGATGLNKQKLLALLPPPDRQCPYGSRTRLWARADVAAFLPRRVEPAPEESAGSLS